MKHLASTMILVFSLLITGCASIENKVTDWAVGAERSMADLQAKQITVAEFSIPYLEGGQGPTVFLIHGFQSNKDIWIRFARQLTKQYHVIAIDLPAHGDSNILMDKSYSIAEQSKRVVAIMEKLKLTQPVHVMGHSMGGAIALHVAVTAPQHVRSLALLSAAGVQSPVPSELSRRNQRGENPLIVRNDQDYKNMLAFSMSDAPYIPSPLISSFTRIAIAREPIATKIYQEISNPGSWLNAEEALPKIKVPALVIWGDQDKVLDVSCTTVFQRLLPQAQVVIFKDVGHAPQLERTKETAQAYATFLATVKP
ncbi:MAG: alpha/beta hydrolase [Rhodoferax sp.]|jgi:abhydrolase domain-containing protein 6|nr:alpha/beta hydrolase [Rhodoferax sp.]